jgi:hypothetical protein
MTIGVQRNGARMTAEMRSAAFLIAKRGIAAAVNDGKQTAAKPTIRVRTLTIKRA